MEGSDGGGMGSVQQAMLQSKMAKEGGGGGVVNLIEQIKGINTSVISAQTGNVDQVGQQAAGAMGLLSGNFLEGMLRLSDLNLFGLPDVVSQAKELQSELAQQAQRVASVLRLEGISPPTQQSPGPVLSPDSTPSMGPSAGRAIDH